MVSLTKKADKLYTECLKRLGACFINTIYLGEFGYKYNVGFAIDDGSVEYKAIGWINGEWQLIDKNNNLYNLHCLPLEQLCQIIDGITKKPNR